MQDVIEVGKRKKSLKKKQMCFYKQRYAKCIIMSYFF